MSTLTLSKHVRACTTLKDDVVRNRIVRPATLHAMRATDPVVMARATLGTQLDRENAIATRIDPFPGATPAEHYRVAHQTRRWGTLAPENTLVFRGRPPPVSLLGMS